MTPEQILAAPPLVLPQRERERYFKDGFLTVPGYVDAAWLARLRAVVTAKIEESIVRGHEATHVHMEPYSAKLPPRWDQVGYRSIFATQNTTAHPTYTD